MATVTLKNNPFHTVGDLPRVNTPAPNFELVGTDLATKKLADFSGKKLVLSVFPSVDTPTCAMSVRTFNQQVAQLDNTVVLCISRDLPFAQTRFCGAEGIDQVVMLSDFKTGAFGQAYGLTFADGPLAGLLSRAIVVIDESGTVVYTEQVSETANEPNYELALAAL